MATNKRFTVSVSIDVTLDGQHLDEVRGKVFRRLLACAKRLTDEYSVNVTGVEYQNDTGEMLFEDYR